MFCGSNSSTKSPSQLKRFAECTLDLSANHQSALLRTGQVPNRFTICYVVQFHRLEIARADHMFIDSNSRLEIMEEGKSRQQPLPSPGEGGNVHCLLLHEMPAWAVKETAMLLNREWPRSLSARMQSIQASPTLPSTTSPFPSGFWMSLLHLQAMPPSVLGPVPPAVLGYLPCSDSFSRYLAIGSNGIGHHLYPAPIPSHAIWLSEAMELATIFAAAKSVALLSCFLQCSCDRRRKIIRSITPFVM
jgi:hypothetical protein